MHHKYIIYITYLYITKYVTFELDHILDRFLIFREFQINKLQNLRPIYTIWIFFLRGFPTYL